MTALITTPGGRFRAVAIAEALSWAGLLAGMFFKYVVVGTETGVHVFGPIHGVIFLVYVAVAALTWAELRWSAPVGLVALLASLPPFGTLVFEQWALRTGRLDSRRAEPGFAEGS